MKAVSNYKAMIEELGRMIGVFANFQNYPFMQLAKEQGWTLDHISEIQGKLPASTMIPEQIKNELIGDGDEAKFVGRLKTAFFELDADPNFVPSYFPMFDETKFELPTNEHPDRNRELLDKLSSVFGKHDAFMMMTRLESICETANYIVQSVSDMLDDVCKFVEEI